MLPPAPMAEGRVRAREAAVVSGALLTVALGITKFKSSKGGQHRHCEVQMLSEEIVSEAHQQPQPKEDHAISAGHVSAGRVFHSTCGAI